LLGRLTVKGGVGKVFEYAGDGLAGLSVPERAVITNMGAELGATTSIFPSDARTSEFLAAMGRPEDFVDLGPEPGAEYDEVIDVDLSSLEPMAAAPHMPDRAVTIASLDGLPVDQAAIGSCTNSSFADLAAASRILDGRTVHPDTELLIAPGSRQVLLMLSREGLMDPLITSGARILECACGPCIGMGGSPPSGGVSARTFNRNFEGRSGTKDGHVYLVSPQTAAKAALDGRFTDPAGWGEPPRPADFPAKVPSIRDMFYDPPADGSRVEIKRGPNIVALEPFETMPETIEAPVALKVGDDITTDHILPGGAEVTALRSNAPAISRHIFSRVDPEFVDRIIEAGRGIILAGENYGQGSSREHAALAPRHLGVKAVLAKSFARIHRANLVNFGILPLILADPADYDRLELGAKLSLDAQALAPGGEIVIGADSGATIAARNDLTDKELAIIRAGGLLNAVRATKASA
jgi:aconitate hydratase